MANLHAGHRERVKERFLRDGLDGFEPHIILELLLFYSIPRIDTNPIAHRLLDSFGSLSGVFEAPYFELLKVDGVGESTATLLKMIPDLSRCYFRDKADTGVVLDSTQKLGAFFLPRFIGHNNEVLYLVCMDRKRKVLCCELLMEGSLDSVTVDLRKMVEAIVKVSATAIALAHNHTQGFAVPSHNDLQVTRELRRTLKMMSVDLVDHIIVARDDFVSMADSGYLSDW